MCLSQDIVKYMTGMVRSFDKLKTRNMELRSKKNDGRYGAEVVHKKKH